MRFGLLYHHQVPRPWSADSDERVLRESLEQVELADRLGFDYVWAAEHHFLDEYAHSSAPEVFLAASAARTRRIRLAHGIVSLPPAVNHPARVAERLATLDLISGGRVDFGTGQGSTQHELGAFGIDRATKREQWREAIDVVIRMLTEVPFTGHQGKWLDMPPRNVVPKPKQQPHPPLWVACSSADTINSAARYGMGALSLAFVTIEEARKWVESYYATLVSEECVPIGRAVNPNFSVVMPFLCHEDQETAYDRGLDGAHFFAYGFAHYYLQGEHRPGVTDLAAELAQYGEMAGFTRHLDDATKAQLPPELVARLESLRRGIGTPDKLREMVRAYADAGVDQIVFQAQTGATSHEHICESLELFAREVMPEFVDGREEREQAKRDRLAIPIKEALSRVEVPAKDVSDYVIRTDMEQFPPTPPTAG
ncbi:alkanesulfonate monooxygenase SsuD/methylene tetrahydromethanopterin reductase-like flavin-dependent oxidoreductase (luciferase family) [Nocardia tenerifensis]|uniref:Alkanesulfonate monooxygenase SsuD/methylene tetrahydromethanopterin reductase-like flavin-dependent oxidoreductase (Luciferase family) n=1 Tax=Nocardia tenerifensis TaxID=228006 RepID=A0A318KCD3_9NOCA|nr:LLM class flavin-dependent oxidoreductase [Nocardia tenerifensis]PXX71487.1 alkanesulfonate monooxygenase SsuD/methylene tetrahydromethanopterin reductase-like flavin-dependent oxidoreductase (luciferase family) [Nocardia tenerifensis]